MSGTYPPGVCGSYPPGTRARVGVPNSRGLSLTLFLSQGRVNA